MTGKRNRRDPNGIAIYRILCAVNGKSYVGQTAYGMDRRFRQHLRSAGAGSNLLIHKALRKHGADAFSIAIVEYVETRDLASVAETRWVSDLRSNEAGFGYNLDAGGRSHNTHAITRAKIAAARRSFLAGMTPAERSIIGKRASAALPKSVRRELALAQIAAMTDEERGAMAARLNAGRTSAQRAASSRAAAAARTPEQRRAAALRREQSRTPEEQAAIRRKGWATRRRKSEVANGGKGEVIRD